jgi:hypothetical protein
MSGIQLFGYLLVAVSAVLLAVHWQQWQGLRGARMRQREWVHVRAQLQRRSVASGLIGVVGAAMTLVERVPREPLPISTYLFALLAGAVVILAIALVDLRATRRWRESEQLDLLAQELKRAATKDDLASASAMPQGEHGR